MITSVEKPIPTTLPLVRFYLDDLEEVRKVALAAAIEAGRILESEIGEKTQTVYTVGSRQCTEISELSKLGYKSNNFEMRVTADNFEFVFGVSGRTKMGWTTAGFPKAIAWRAFHKLEVICAPRLIQGRSWLPDSNNWLLWLLALAAILGSLAALKGTASIVVSTLGVTSLILVPELKRSEFVFRYSWDDWEKRQDLNSKILIGLCSAAAASFLSLLGAYLKQKYWP